MYVLYGILFLILLIFSAFFSSAETAMLSLNKIKLSVKARKKNKKAILNSKLLSKPNEFLSTVLIGNNFVNIAAASISTVVFTQLFYWDRELGLLVSTLFSTTVVLFFSEIIPKSFAYRYNEKFADFYAYPIQFIKHLLAPFVKITSGLANLLFRKDMSPDMGKDLTVEEIKHFLATDISLFKYNPDSLRMINVILDIAEKDIKTMMTPRLNVIALDEKLGMQELKRIMLSTKIANIPVYRDNLDNIIGIIYNEDVLDTILVKNYDDLELKEIMRPPVFVSEYSSLNYVMKEFNRSGLEIAVIVDEYGSTIGILTFADIFREIMGEINLDHSPIKKYGRNAFIIKGNLPVEEINHQLALDLPIRVDYSTISGLFIYHFGKFPKEYSRIRIKDTRLMVKRMGKRKIDEILLIKDEELKK